MAIVTQCPDCGKKLKAAETHIGKKTKCPQCQKPFEIKPVVGGEQTVAPPADLPQKKAAPAPKRPAPVGPASTAVQPREDWFLQTADGEEYGPVSRSELDEWFAEGRIDNECQLLREGWDQWKWAEEVFPELANGDGGATAGDADNPFAGIVTEKPAAADPFTGIAAAATSSANPYAAPSPTAAVETKDSGGSVTRGMVTAMRQTKPWIMLFMILGGLVTGLLGLAMMLSVLTIIASPLIGLFNFLFHALYVGVYGYITFLLYKYFDSLGKFERTPSTMSLEKALIAQKNFWQFSGILTLIAMGLGLLGFLVVIFMLGGIAAMAGGGASQF